MAEMSEKNKSVLGKLRDKMDGGINRLLTTLAFVGCVNAMSAKTITGSIIKLDNSKTYLMTNEGKMKIYSPSLAQAITRAHNKRGGELVVTFNLDESNSTVTNGYVSHSPVRYSSGITDARNDIRNQIDNVHELISYARDLNLSRLLNKSSEMAADLAPEPFRGGEVRTIATNSKGEKGWGLWHQVENGRLKPEYDKTATQTSQSNYNYTSTYSGSDNRNQAQKPPKVNLRIYE